MKYSIHSTEAEAEAEITRIEAYLGIPTLGTIQYAEPEELEGQWRFRVKESGPWKCDNVATNVVEEYTP
jgi:hypothetical protein